MLPVLLEEAAAFHPKIEHRLDGSAVAAVHLEGSLAALFAARTWMSLALPGEAVKIEAAAGPPVREIARAIFLGGARQAATALTEGPVRYRLAWAGGGKRRASVYAIAEAVRELDAGLVNDPTDAPWQIVVREAADRVAVEWVPALDDPRFAYRRGDVPAASHPTIAAALAFVAGARDDDVVWDPFVGSGLELCERAQRGAYARLVGTDLDPAALDVARANLEACGAARFDLALHDAAKGAPAGMRPTLIVTNPPMGRRVHRSADLRAFLPRFVAAAARSLAPSGRFAWLSPFPRDTRAAAESAGLAPRRFHVIDMGGFDAELQVFWK
jgi:predicted RNA methylase